MASVEEKTTQQLEVLPSGVLLDAKKPDGTPLDQEDLIDMVKQLRRSAGGVAMSDEKAVAVVYHQLSQVHHHKSRAFYRVNATRAVTGSKMPPVKPSRKMSSKVAAVTPEEEPVTINPGQSVLEFAAASYAIVEGAGKVTVQVLREGDVSKEATIEYATVDGTATGGAQPGDGADYETVSAGILTFAPGQTAQDLAITIYDDDDFEDDETFTIELKRVVTGDASLGEMRSTRITIINDDFPGTFHLTEEDIMVKATCGTCKITVERVFGCSGAVSMTYTTIDGSALAGKDYTKVEGKLEWAHKDVEPKTIEIPILDLDNLVKKVYFEVEIGGATGGSIFDEQTDGNKEKSLARITITDDDAVKNIADNVIVMLGLNHVTMRLGASTWREQFTSAFEVGGGDDEEEGVTEEGGTPAKPGAYAYVMMVICLPWKLIAAIVPPASIGGGYPCFFVAILLIGVQTAFISDFASLSGCAMGIKDEVVAFTLVAAGTSLKDNFASFTAARHDTTADGAIGNVTGSNFVNVFLGLGISWVIGAFYWSIYGVTEDWLAIYGLSGIGPHYCQGLGRQGHHGVCQRALRLGDIHPDQGGRPNRARSARRLAKHFSVDLFYRSVRRHCHPCLAPIFSRQRAWYEVPLDDLWPLPPSLFRLLQSVDLGGI
jgi:solute carrier family 8 (sodium/calcium exchanger)